MSFGHALTDSAFQQRLPGLNFLNLCAFLQWKQMSSCPFPLNLMVQFADVVGNCKEQALGHYVLFPTAQEPSEATVVFQLSE